MRRAAFDNAGLDEPTRTLVEKVANRSYAVTDEDVAAARAAGSQRGPDLRVHGVRRRRSRRPAIHLRDGRAHRGDRRWAMRLEILDSGHRLSARALFGVIRLMTRQPVVDAVKLAFYRKDFYGAGPLTNEAMRGPSQWSVGERELMAAFVAKANDARSASPRTRRRQASGTATTRKWRPHLPIWTPRPSRSRCGRRCACSASSPASTASTPTTSGPCWTRASPLRRSKTPLPSASPSTSPHGWPTPSTSTWRVPPR